MCSYGQYLLNITNSTFRTLLFLVLTYALLCNCQLYGGTNGPCSANFISPPYNKPITVFGSNVGAVPFNGTNSCLPTSSGVVWYIIDIDTSPTNISLSTCAPGTNFDTFIGIYTGTSCGSLQCVTFSDNENSCSYSTNYASLLFFPNRSPIRYYIAVGGGVNQAQGISLLLLIEDNCFNFGNQEISSSL